MQNHGEIKTEKQIEHWNYVSSFFIQIPVFKILLLICFKV